MWRLTLFAIVFCFSVQAQNDTNTRQIEISGGTYRLYKVLYSQFSLGVNFPARKDNWYNNLALSVNIHDATKRGGSTFALYSLSVGKSYQWINKHFFSTAGFNTGLYYGSFAYNPIMIRHIGINGIPKLEIGYNAKKVILSTGIYFSMGVSYRAEYFEGKFVEQPRPQDYIRFIGTTNLYLKLILK